MKALIKVGYGCNNHCTFCHTLDVREVEGASTEVHAKIERAARLGHTMIVLSGGEVTMRSELLQWAAHSASLGLDFGLVTNGRMLAYPELVEKLFKYRLKYVYMSLHGGNAKIHNLMVRADAFEQTYAAIANLSGHGLDFTVNAVVTRHNLTHLRPIVDAVLPYPDVVLKFSMVQPKGGGEKLFDHLMPPIADVAAKIHDAITYGLEKTGGRGPNFAHDGIPLCLLPGYEALYDDLKTHRFWTMIEIGEPDFFPVDDKAKTQPEKCRSCALRGPCPGLYSGYLEEFGDAALRPVTDRPRSNSFNYALERPFGRVTSTNPAECPIRRDGITPWDRGRHVFVRKGDQVAVFRSDSRDFADTEIEAIKHEHGQLYVDISDKPAPDDFARDLRQLRRMPMCSQCDERDRCSGLFEPVRDDVFTRDDARVRTLLGTLTGDVLDLGCGEGPYAEALEARARSGEVRYLGVDPDPKRIEALEKRWSWAQLRVGDAETVDVAGSRFDHVLVLRSWNHLREPGHVLDRIARMLRPGGTLTVVDNIAFGLLRTRPQVARAESSDAQFEHFRNDTAADAHTCIALHGFELIERHEVAPGTSNQWLLRYRRADAATTVAAVADAE